MSARRGLTIEEVAAQLEALGVQRGGVLLAHCSFRAVRPMEGGPAGLIQALRDALGGEGTLVMPSWTDDDDSPFDPARTAAAHALGIVPDTFWRLAGVLRSDHPFALAAAGPRASEIVSGPLPIPPQAPGSPIDRVRALDGQLLLIGVGHDTNTTLHLAELIAGVPYGVPKHVTVREGGASRRVDYAENDHCCAGFSRVDGWLRERGLQREGPVGHAEARLARSRDVVDVALERLREDPHVFLCAAEAGCEECDAARATAV